MLTIAFGMNGLIHAVPFGESHSGVKLSDATELMYDISSYRFCITLRCVLHVTCTLYAFHSILLSMSGNLDNLLDKLNLRI